MSKSSAKNFDILFYALISDIIATFVLFCSTINDYDIIIIK
jgi:hypothetical protein